MFGMGFFEIFTVLVIAIIFLGPEKLPKAMVDVAKFFKAVKKTMDEAKESIDKELKIEELKQEALGYKNSLTQDLSKITQESGINDLNSIFSDTPKSSQQNNLQESLNAQSLEDKQEHEQQNISITPQSDAKKIGFKNSKKES